MSVLDFFVRRAVPAPKAPGGNGSPDFLVPVADPKPVGRIEWAELGPFLYGIDRAGTIFRGGHLGSF